MYANPTLRPWADPSREDLSVMLGAACGDIAGSVYEWRNIRYKLDANHLIAPDARFTDDTVMTCAVADGLRRALSALPEDWMGSAEAEDVITAAVQEAMRTFGHRFPRAGYGGKFAQWLCADDPQPYGSWGNGSAMRVSFAGWLARSLEEAERLATLTAQVTHNHPEGLKGAVCTAGCIFLLRQGADKEAVRAYASGFYNMDFTLGEIRDTYTFNASCSGSVPQAIEAFLEGQSFADVLSCAISIGGDSDTIAAIAGSLAEVIYPIPGQLRGAVTGRLDPFLLQTLQSAADFARSRG